MELKEILSITGKPGLYKLVAQSRTGVIVESLLDGKRFPVMASHNVSALADIAIYTYNEEVPLADVFRSIYKKEDGGEAISHKSSAAELKSYFMEVVPEFDEERVYVSDIKKVLNWYNMLQSKGLVDAEEDAVEEEATAENEEKPAE